MKNNNLKSGITMIILVVTIVVAIILLLTVTVAAKNIYDNTVKSNFATDMTLLEDAVKTYYQANNILPTKDQNTSMSELDVVALINDINPQVEFSNELELNGDRVKDGTKDNEVKFYELDLSMIEAENITKGTKETPDDVYVIAYPSIHVYYVKGIEVKDEYYFSLSSKLTTRAN